MNRLPPTITRHCNWRALTESSRTSNNRGSRLETCSLCAANRVQSLLSWAPCSPLDFKLGAGPPLMPFSLFSESDSKGHCARIGPGAGKASRETSFSRSISRRCAVQLLHQEKRRRRLLPVRGTAEKGLNHGIRGSDVRVLLYGSDSLWARLEPGYEAIRYLGSPDDRRYWSASTVIWTPVHPLRAAVDIYPTEIAGTNIGAFWKSWK